MGTVSGAGNRPGGRPGGGEEPFELDAGDDVFILSVPELPAFPGVKNLEAG
jgi:hypothetical protein